MKKIALLFLSLIITTPLFANIHINPDTVVSVVKEHIPDDKVNDVIREYNAQVKVSNGAGIAANKLWNVCAAAGWNIKESAGKSKCQEFVNALVKSGKLVFKEVCGNDKGKTGATERCVTDFKNVKVNIGPAIAIAKEYARVKYKDDSLQCFNKHRGSWNDDYVKCVSQNLNTFYEFQFDSVTASIDNTIKNGIQHAVCAIHGAPATTAGFIGGGTNVSATSAYVDASCAADSAKCKEINKSLNRFGYVAEYKNNTCKISFETVSDRADLRTAFGIDNFVFCAGIQARNNQSTETYVKNYIASKAGVSAANVKCDAGFKTYTGPGCKVNGMTDFKDDIKTCYVGGKQIDLVFDDINEDWDHVVKSGEAGISCIINTGGRFDGKHCRGLNPAECDDADKVIPGGTDWDIGANACVLKDARSAQRINNGITIATGIVITVGTLGVGTVIGAGVSATTAVVAVVGSVAVDGAFIGLERLQETKPHHRALQFMNDAKNCNNATCAANIVKEHIARLGEVLQDLNNDELDAVSVEMDRIAGLQTDDQFVAAMNSSTLKVEDYALKASTAVLIAATLFIAPEQAVKRVWGRAAKFAGKMERFMTDVGVIGTHADDITRIAGRFGKSVLLRQSSTLGGKYYYRIMVNEGEDVSEIISNLQRNGWYVSANKTTDGQKFIAVSGDNIFGAWDNSASNWLKYGGNVIKNLEDELNGILRGFNKRVSLRRGAENSLGQDYYRIQVTNQDDVINIVNVLQQNGYYVSSNMTNSGDYFLAISKENIFGPWANAPTNWLRGGSDGIFSKVYNNMPNEILQQKLEYVYSHSQTQEAAIKALKDVGAFDEMRATELANDLAGEISARLQGRSDIINAARKWSSLNTQQRKALVLELHEAVTTTRRNHVGNTIVGFDIDNPNLYGSHRAPYNDFGREFKYNVNVNDFERVLDTIIHENTHAFQSLGKSSIAEPFVQWAKKNYTDKGNLYWENVIEMESRHVGGLASKKVIQTFGI